MGGVWVQAQRVRLLQAPVQLPPGNGRVALQGRRSWVCLRGGCAREILQGRQCLVFSTTLVNINWLRLPSPGRVGERKMHPPSPILVCHGRNSEEREMGIGWDPAGISSLLQTPRTEDTCETGQEEGEMQAWLAWEGGRW